MTDESMPRCICGKPVDFWSGLLDQGFCGDKCYNETREKEKNNDETDRSTEQVEG